MNSVSPSLRPAESSGAHRTALDGVRALAVVGVVLIHAGFPGFLFGWIGVDVFFVLSGFLITTLLVMESAASGSIAYGAFMARRALRLMPAYFLYIAFVTAMIWWWPGSVRSENGGWNAAGLTAALWTYTVNFVPQGGVWNGQELTIHLWSLSVEQQYYLVWPLVFLALGGRPGVRRWTAAGLAVATMLVFIACPPGLYKNNLLPTRGFSLVVASAVALWAWHRPHLLRVRGFNRLTDIAGAALLLALAVLSYRPGWDGDRIRGVFVPLLVPVFALWMARLWAIDGSGTIRQLLQRRSVVYIGKISYGIYLYHEAVRIAVWDLLKPPMSGWPPVLGFAVRVVIYVGLSLLLAALSYEQLEKRFLRLADRFRPARVARTPS